MTRTDREQLDDLLSTLVDGRIDGVGQDRLAVLLRDATARRRYLAFMRLHADLSIDRQIDAPVISAERLRDNRRPNDRFWFAAIVSALSLLVIAGWWQAFSIDQPTIASIASISISDGSVIASGSDAYQSDGELSAGKLSLETGKATLKMLSGAEVRLSAPASIELLDAKAIRLIAGRITADVPDQAIGFRILTPTADVIDLGTSFGIEVDDAGATEVHVFDGVVAARGSEEADIVPIAAGEGGRVELSGGELVAVAYDGSRFDSIRRADSIKPVSGSDSGEGSAPVDGDGPIPAEARVVFLGDRATSRGTHLLLIDQTLASQFNGDRPTFFNEGVTFPLSFDETDFHDRILAHRPTHAVLEFANDIARDDGRRTPTEYRRDMLRLIERLKAAGIEPVLTTGYPFDHDFEEPRTALNAYNSIVRQIAVEHRLRLADYYDGFVERGDPPSLVYKRFETPMFHGYHEMAECLLEAFGYPDLKVALKLHGLKTFPGVIEKWRYQSIERNLEIDEAYISSMNVDAEWDIVEIPEVDGFSRRRTEPTHSNHFQETEVGFVRSFRGARNRKYILASTINVPHSQEVTVNVGGTVRSVWLNGERIVEPPKYHRGWQPTAVRSDISLVAGRNQIVIETFDDFFFSLTKDADWGVTSLHTNEEPATFHTITP
ncbi:FecR domain-containing protein [Stratiformator vulcanicus]|uniref:FecR protein n=1 Tax=Stratiformator vulcanicus TaxID=2527980 RepID=A0A517R1H9_9PLAN|nr:FecR domain-containing protein [Stratiformator vulcanicus]QDT37703.1 FecR protein [Stratiformator vulcanicus]